MNHQFQQDRSEVKESIRERLDIAQVVGRYVKLKSAGHNLKGLCPFHKEKTPSFVVSPDKGMYHCFGCGKGGDIFSFIMEVEGLTFPETLARMAEEAGVALPTYAPQQRQKESTGSLSKTEALHIHELATRFYYDQMKQSTETIDYFKSRSLSSQTVKDFRLGYAPSGWSSLTDHLKTLRISEEKIVAAGLAIASTSGGRCYDRFRNRLIFPVFDIVGKPIAFGGRSLNDKEMPKYLNSPDTILYRKNRILYGLHQARPDIKESGFAIFVEGYMDFLSLFQVGVQNVVATSGTALTEEHGYLIRRFTNRVVLVFDGDTAGLSAAERALFVLAPQQLDLRVMLLAAGEDPDSLVKKKGVAAFNEALKQAQHALTFLCNRAYVLHDKSSPLGKSAIVEYLLPFVSASKDPIVQSDYIKQISEELDIPQQLLYDKLRRVKPSQSEETAEVSENKAKQYLETEMGSFFHLLLQDPTLLKVAQKYITKEIFTDYFSNNLYSLIIDTCEQNRSFSSIIDFTDDQALKNILSIMLTKEVVTENYEEDLKHKAKKCLVKLYKQRQKAITKQLKREQRSDIKKQLIESQKEFISHLGALQKEW